MDRSEIIRILQSHQAELQKMGISRLDLFGSCARGDATGESDVDLLADFAEPVSLFAIARMQSRLSRMLQGRAVDLVPVSCVPEPKLAGIREELVNAYSK